MYELDILCGISKDAFEILHKIAHPYNWKMWILFTGEYSRALRFKSS